MVESFAIIYVLGAIIALTIILMSLAFLFKALKIASLSVQADENTFDL